MTKKFSTGSSLMKTVSRTDKFVTVVSKRENLLTSRGIEKELLENGLQAELDYINNFTGANVQRSETRLYPLYNALAEILRLHGKIDVVAQGVNNKKELTVKYKGNTYNDVTASLQVSTDLIYRDVYDIEEICRGMEVRCGSKNLAKNIHNNVRALTGEAMHFNHAISTVSKTRGNYFTVVTFIDMDNSEYNRVVASTLALHELGFKAAVVPYKVVECKRVVLLGAVPEPVQLMRVIRGN